MSNCFRPAVLGLAATAMLLGVSRADAEALTPTGGWTVDYGETQCIALRQFGSKEAGWMFGLRPAFNGENFEIMLSRAGKGPSAPAEDKGFVDLGAGPLQTWVLKYTTPGKDMIVERYRVPAADVRKLSSKAEFVLSNGARRVLLAPDGLISVVKALDTCLADLRRHWNSDARPTKVATSAKGDVRSLFTADDYPDSAIEAGLQGDATYILLIDEKGKVAGCDLVTPSGIPALDFMGCEVFRKRALFTPALDVSGKPTRDTIVTPPVRWKIM